jgi:hypothetical protein
MNKIITLIALFFLASCTPENNHTKENIQIVEQYVQAVENLDYESMSSLLDDNYLGLGPSYGDSIRKAEAVENWKYTSENLYEKIKYDRSRNASIFVADGPDQGEWVSNWAELTINYQWTDTPVTLWANSIYKIENGKIIKSYTFYNEADVYRQLGLDLIN